MDEEESDNSTTTKDDESKDSDILDHKLTEICMKNAADENYQYQYGDATVWQMRSTKS